MIIIIVQMRKSDLKEIKHFGQDQALNTYLPLHKGQNKSM